MAFRLKDGRHYKGRICWAKLNKWEIGFYFKSEHSCGRDSLSCKCHSLSVIVGFFGDAAETCFWCSCSPDIFCYCWRLWIFSVAKDRRVVARRCHQQESIRTWWTISLVVSTLSCLFNMFSGFITLSLPLYPILGSLFCMVISLRDGGCSKGVYIHRKTGSRCLLKFTWPLRMSASEATSHCREVEVSINSWRGFEDDGEDLITQFDDMIKGKVCKMKRSIFR